MLPAAGSGGRRPRPPRGLASGVRYRISALGRRGGMASRYPEVYAAWQRDPQAFWAEAAQEIDWIEPPKTIFDPKAGVYGRWFPDAVCNTCWNAIDRHVQGGRAAQPGLIYDSPMAGAKRVYTYAQLLEEVRTLAGVLEEFGVTKGDRVVIYMPMVPEALYAIL